ncbi:putative periplasmic serine endoprotease DegP-like precursor [Gimesia alba]|uniref:Putative periplasmic serine endoprotease DegP-like n=1 Tax=Gimesia alba TaxID=2527973 RepID=A0A517RFM5_9PLAN|nr:trypsin-like peptidase domain-containing protein [Gimesia alba]QDT42674.1 putative periplasmic serine endoprotease DegP-like precursor [Gimesia alba]
MDRLRSVDGTRTREQSHRHLDELSHRMIKCFYKLTLCTMMLVTGLGAFCENSIASDVRKTPLVRAIERAKTSVVNIHSEKTARTEDSLFGSGKSRKVNGMGTGIIVDPRGYIVTNHHVIDGVDSLRVTMMDGSTYNARIISSNQSEDLAIIKINPTKKLTVMPPGTSSDLMLGETVIAVGNAFGYEHSVTSGIISSLSRDVEVNEKQSYKNLIQTDASINPGNSGGPLLNLDGEVVGINVAIRAGAQRIGFAIPIDDARKIIADLISTELIDHTYHGILANDIKQGDKQMLVLGNPAKDSPAEKSGLKKDDIVMKAGSVNVVDRADLERAFMGHKPGDTIDLLIRRDEKTQSVQITLADSTTVARTTPVSAPIVRAQNNEISNDPTLEKTWEVLGIRITKITEAQKHMLNPRYEGGMLIEEVRPQSPAAMNGMRRGDILVGLHIWETVNLSNISYVLSNSKLPTFNPLKFYILRKNETLYGHLPLNLTGTP